MTHSANKPNSKTAATFFAFNLLLFSFLKAAANLLCLPKLIRDLAAALEGCCCVLTILNRDNADDYRPVLKAVLPWVARTGSVESVRLFWVFTTSTTEYLLCVELHKNLRAVFFPSGPLGRSPEVVVGAFSAPQPPLPPLCNTSARPFCRITLRVSLPVFVLGEHTESVSCCLLHITSAFRIRPT